MNPISRNPGSTPGGGGGGAEVKDNQSVWDEFVQCEKRVSGVSDLYTSLVELKDFI